MTVGSDGLFAPRRRGEMGRVRALSISGYRSINNRIDITFPERTPLVLIGENNAGKSNIVSALELVLGERWPGSHDPDDHEFFGRNRDGNEIEVTVELDGVRCSYQQAERIVERLIWRFPWGQEGTPFRMRLKWLDRNPYATSMVRDQCPCIVIGADRRLSYHLSYASPYTFLSKLTKRFHKLLEGDADTVERLRTRYDELTHVFEDVDEFVVFKRELRNQVDDLSGNLAYGLGVDFSPYDPSNYFRSLRVQPKEDTEIRTFEELGTGQEQILAICFAYAYARTFHDAEGLVLVIEEPEAHLHPLAQRWLGHKVQELASTGVQVVITTHSPAFLDILDLEGFVRVCKPSGATEVVQVTAAEFADFCREHEASKVDDTSVLPFYSAAATEEILAGLFSRKVVLVEGQTEALALPVYLAKCGIQTARDGVAIIPVGGVGNLAKWWRFFSAFEIPCYVIFDNDAEDDAKSVKRADVLSTLDVAQGEHSQLLRTREWITRDRFCIFGGNFEEILETYFGDDYVRLEGEARDRFGLSTKQSKPLVARYIAERLPKNVYHHGWESFHELADAIKDLGTVSMAQTGNQQVTDDFDEDFDDVPFD